MPVPMIAPMPSFVTATGPSDRFRAACGSSATARISSSPFVRNRLLSKGDLLGLGRWSVWEWSVVRGQSSVVGDGHFLTTDHRPLPAGDDDRLPPEGGPGQVGGGEE